MRKYWTTGEITRLERLVRADKTANEIATILGRTPHSIYNQKKQLKICNSFTRNEWTQAEITRLGKLVNARMPVKQIARIMGKTTASINSRKARINLKKPPRLSPKVPLHIAEVIKFKMAGWKLKEIAAVYRCSESQVSDVLCKNGIIWFMRGKPNYETQTYQRWDEIDLARMRRACKRGYTLDEICALFPYRSLKAVRERINQMTRYWDRRYTLDAQAKARML